MKHFHSNLLLTFLYLSFSTFSLSQSYTSIFGDESTTWKIPFCNLDQFIITEQVSNSEITHNSNTYKKIGTSFFISAKYRRFSLSVGVRINFNEWLTSTLFYMTLINFNSCPWLTSILFYLTMNNFNELS